jgi:spermidine/putrescine transport system permease protein
MKRSRVPFFTTIAVLIFFYLPLVILSVNSFNDSRYGGPWNGFTFRWYVRLFHDQHIWNALKNTLIIASSATLVSMVAGTVAAFALNRYRSRLQLVHYGMIYSPLIVPDILMGMSLLLFESQAGAVYHLSRARDILYQLCRHGGAEPVAGF